MHLVKHPKRASLSRKLKGFTRGGPLEQHDPAFWQCLVELPSDKSMRESAIQFLLESGCEVQPAGKTKRNSGAAQQPPGDPKPQQYAGARLTLETREQLRFVQQALQVKQDKLAAEHGLKPAQVSLSDAALAAAKVWLQRETD